MENKKTKLTISGGPKKSFKNIDSVNNQGKKTVIINRQSSKFPGKGKFRISANNVEVSYRHKITKNYTFPYSSINIFT